MIKKFEEFVNEQLLTEYSEAGYRAAADKARKLGQHKRYAELDTHADVTATKKFEKDNEISKLDYSKINRFIIDRGGFTCHVPFGDGTDDRSDKASGIKYKFIYSKIDDSIGVQNYAADRDNRYTEIDQKSAHDLGLSRASIRIIVNYFKEYNPKSKFADKNVWIS